MPGAASQSSAQSLHRTLPPHRQNAPAPSTEAATPFADLLDSHESSIEPRDRPDPVPRDTAPPRQPTGVRSKPAAKPADRNDTKRAASDDAPPRSTDDKAPAQDAKDTGDTDKTDADTAIEAASKDDKKADITVADATNAIVDIQPVTPAPVAAVLSVQIDVAAAETKGGEEKPADVVLAPTPAPVSAPALETSPAEDALAAQAATKPEKPAATKPAAEQPEGDEKAAKAEGPVQTAELPQAVASKDDAKSDQDEKHAAHAEAKEIKAASKAESRIEAPQADTAPARTADQNLTPTTQATHQTQAPAQAAATAQAAAAASSPVPVPGLAVEIAAQSRAGKNHFEIRLDPPELGRINVRLEMDGNGHVRSHLIVDRVETLDLLRRDAPQLERALEQAGMKTSENGLQFSLRDQSPQNPQQQQDDQRTAKIVVADAEIAAESAQRQYGRLAGLGGGLDIRV